MSEEWLPVTIPGCSGYSVSSESNIRTANGTILKPSRQGNVTLSGTLGKVRKYAHIVSCLAFHGPKPSPTHTVDHIDRNWKNNKISNLRWASKSLQIQNRTNVRKKGVRVVYKTPTNSVSFMSVVEAARYFGIKKTTLHLWLKRDMTVNVTGGVLQFDELLPANDSIIKVVPSWILNGNKQAVVKVSSCGLVTSGRRWTIGCETGRPAKYFSTGTGGKSKFLVHRLIAAAFFGKPDEPGKIYVNHKDGNGFNNRIGNLEWVSPSENNVHAIEIGLVGGLTPVVQYNLDGIRLAEFHSISEAARFVNGISQNIYQACKNIRPSAYSFMWSFKSEAVEQMAPISRGSRSKEVRQYDLHGTLITTFVSGREAAKVLGVSAPRITTCCKRGIRLGSYTLQTDPE